MLTVWSRERGTELLNAVKFSGVDWQSGETPPNPKGDVVLCLGKVPHEYFTKQGILPKNRTITSLRGLPHKANLWGREVLLMFSYSTGIGAVDYRKYVDLQLDFGTALRLETTGSLSPKLGEYRYVKDFSESIAKLKERIASGEARIDVALDLETLGLDPYAVAYTETKGKKEIHVPAAYIITIQITTAEGHSDVVYFESKDEMKHWVKKHKDQLDFILNCQDLVMNGANLKFDLHWLKVHADVECSNFKFDTTLVGSCLDENRSNALDVHTKIYTPILGGYSDIFDKTVDKGRMDLVKKDFLLGYAGGDTDATWRIKQVMKKELLKQPRLASFYVNVLHPAGRAFEKVEQTGVHIDLDRFNELEIEVSGEMSRLVGEARKLLGGRLWAKHHDDTRADGINLTKASLIKDYMFSPMGLNLRPKVKTEKTGEPSTAMEHLELFAEHPDAKEFVSLLSEYGSASKTLSTYLTGFRKHLRSDGRFHPSYFLFAGNRDAGDGGTVTGRLSVKDPAFQCLVGETLVLTSNGDQTIESIVAGYEQGKEYTVLTHTGKWKKVIGVYRNGIKKVFSVRLKSGKVVKSTENHPYLTQRGWVRTDQLLKGDTCYELGTQNTELHQSNILQLGSHEKPLLIGDQQGLSTLRGQGDKATQTLGVIPNFPKGHGGEASQGVFDRAQGCERELRAEQLLLGDTTGTSQQPNQHKADNMERENSNRGTVGERVRYNEGKATLSPQCWDDNGTSLDEAEPWDRAIFQAVEVESIDCWGEYETYDLTVDGSHSFVANGVVVHNTIPKHTDWGKKIRSCYTAPEGFVVGEFDYSQGELRVVACVANEENMIEAYRNGKDLHTLTASELLSMSYDELVGMKKTNKDQFDVYRQYGKPCNFGLLYGMSAASLVEYARINYGVHFTLEQATEFREKFLYKAYPMLPVYHQQYKAMAKRYGQVESPLGRIRHLPLINSRFSDIRSGAERQAINSPIQGCLSDMLCWAMAISNETGLVKIAPDFGAIHDATYKYIPEDRVDEVVERQLEIMENLPFHKVGWNPQLKFIADAKVGQSMGELSEWSKAS